MAPGDLERVLVSLPADPWAAGRLLTCSGRNEDAAIVRVPEGKALVQTVDFFTPVVNDPYRFGQIAAANALSDVYAMGGEPWTAMNIVCFPSETLGTDVLSAILRGGADKIAEAGAALAGGHSVEDREVKYGLSVTGLVDPDGFAANGNLVPGDALLMTKALGTGILATAIKAYWDGCDAMEEDLYRSAARLNAVPGAVIRKLGIRAATDITGFGFGGHLLEMLHASNCAAAIHTGQLTLLPRALELAGMGLVPAGSHANRAHRAADCRVEPGVAPFVPDLVFDAQTSGGMILAVPPDQVANAVSMLADGGETVAVVGEVLAAKPGEALLHLYP